MTDTIVTAVDHEFQTNDGQTFYVLTDTRVANNVGQIALKVQRHAHPRAITIGGLSYSFVPRANISLAWVNLDHVASVLAIKRKGCCNKSQFEFMLANESDVRRWTNGGGQ